MEKSTELGSKRGGIILSRRVYGEIPYVLRENNLVVSRRRGTRGESECFAVYELYQQHSEFLKEDDLVSDLIKLEAIMAKLKYAGHFSLVPVEIDIDFLADSSDVPASLHQYHEQSIENMKRHILKRPYQYRLYLTMNVKELAGNPVIDFFNALWESLRDPARQMESKLGGLPFTLAKSQWERFRRDEQKVFNLLSRFFEIRRLTFEEVGIFIERCAMRGVEPRLKRGSGSIQQFDQIVMASPAEILPAFEDVEHDPGEIPGMLKFRKVFPEGIKEGFFSFMTIGRLPNGESLYPYETALFKLVQEFPFPIELNVSFYPLEWSYVQHKLRGISWWSNSKRKSKVSRGKEVDHGLLNILSESRDLAYYLTTKGYPMFRTQITLCVWGNTPEQVYERRELVADALNKYQVNIPTYLQKQLFYNTLPGNPKKMGYQYQVMATPQFLAALNPLGTIKLGDPTGYLMGYSGSVGQSREAYKIPVLFDPRRGSREKKRSNSPAIINIGSPGTGKSLTANYLVIENVLHGAKALVFDPKNERWAWPYELPEFADMMNMVTLREGLEDKGKLDPLLRVNGGSTDRSAINSAKRILWFLSGWSSDSYGGKAIGYAVDRVASEYQQHQPCMKRVIDLLNQYLHGEVDFNFPDFDFVKKKALEQIADLLADLQYNAGSSLAQLLFAEGHEKPIDLSYPLTILQVQGLMRPKKDDPDYRHHMAVIMGICDLAREFVEQEAAFRTVVFDEFHEFSEEEEIRVMVRTLLRKGRSMNNIVQLITHNTRDLILDKDLNEEDSGSEVRSNLGCRFVYRVNDRGEARKVCEILGITPTEDVIDLLTNSERLQSGDFLMRDFDGRIGIVHFPLDEIDPRLYEAFRTDQEANKKRIERYGHLQQQLAEVEG
jgi:hypothetical protein